MKRILLANILGALLLPLFAASADAGVVPGSPHLGMWRDAFGDPIDGYVEAAPGETITVYYEVNDEFGVWDPVWRVVNEVWWDSAVVEPFSMYQNYNYVPDVDSMTSGQYWAGQHYRNATNHNYNYTDLQGVNGYFYDGLRVVGWDIQIRADAPVGETDIGSRLIGYSYYTGAVNFNSTIEAGDPFALTINVVAGVPEPATVSLLAIGLVGLGLIGWRRRKNRS